jgi:WD40 repeat protein
LLSCAADYSLRVWNANTGGEMWAVDNLDKNVTSVAYSPDGMRILTGAEDGLVVLRDAVTGKELARYPGHKGAVNSVAFSPAGSVAASGGDDKTVHIWQVPK